jgi:hypothetical protein
MGTKEEDVRAGKEARKNGRKEGRTSLDKD